MINSKYTLSFYEQKIANFENKSNWSFKGLPVKHNFIFDKMRIISELRKLTKGLRKLSCSHDDWIKETFRGNKGFPNELLWSRWIFNVKQWVSSINGMLISITIWWLLKPTKSIHFENVSFKSFPLTISAYKFFDSLILKIYPFFFYFYFLFFSFHTIY